MVSYTPTEIHSTYEYSDTLVQGTSIHPINHNLQFKTSLSVRRTGVMLIGWGGNNGSTFTASLIANKTFTSWPTKEGEVNSNYLGSICKSMTIRLGVDENNQPVFVPMSKVIPLLDPNSLEVTGWDISNVNLGDAMRRSKVLDYALQEKLYSTLKEMVPMPSVFLPDWIASSQRERANNVLQGSRAEMLAVIRANIREFKENRALEQVVVVWTANTEKDSVVRCGVNDNAEHLLNAIESNSEEVSPSTLFAVASIQEGCIYINGSPHNTFVPGVVELAEKEGVLICGDDFKSGQTKLKSVLSDFIINSGLKLRSLVSYNHLGNNDIRNLSAPQASGSKELGKSGIIEEIIRANRIMYRDDESPDHCVVFKYVPYVGDHKTAMDEYMSEIFMGGTNTIVLHNTGEDSLLAAPLIVDLLILSELCSRVQVKLDKDDNFTKLHPVLSILSYLMKSPLVPSGSPVTHCLFPQRFAIINFIRALIGLPPDNFLMLEHRLSCLRR
jgi:myo-inositol-1-phosphate synthase